MYAPEPNTVQRGRVTRLEPYGAFVQLTNFRARGLVHKSHLASFRVENVSDAVAIDDEVWVKVIDVSKDIDEETGKARHRVSLSMKYVRQEDGTDLDPDGEQAAEELANRQSGGNSGDGRGGGGRGGGYGGGDAAGVAMANAIERNLGSNIGMASAIDPMASHHPQKGSRVVLRGGSGPSGVIDGNLTFNGYALVGDDEGEVDVNNVGHVSGNSVQVQSPAKPMGRGRGTTLPAWMTARDLDDNIGGVKKDPRDNGAYSSCNESSSSVDSSRSRSRRKKRKKRESSKRKKKGRRDRHKEREGRGDRRRRRSRSRSRSRNRSRSRSRDRDRGSDRHRRREKRQNKDRRRDGIEEKRQDRRARSRSVDQRSPSRSISSRSRSKSRSGNHQRNPSKEFESIEEAKALIARLEKQKR